MSWPLSILISLLAGGVALACMLPVTIGLVDWYSVPSREGASGYFVIFHSLLAGLIGAIIGCFVARQAGPGFGVALLWAAGVNVILCALIAGVGYLFAPHREQSPEVDLECSQAEAEAAREARAQAEFAAVPGGAPLEAWFPYLVMRQDVLRVASHYAGKWAGVAPLPGDPPPN